MKKILIAGGSGMIGRTLSQHLTRVGYEVHWLSRSSQDGPFTNHHWDILSGALDQEALSNTWGIINLSGAGIVDKAWTSARKKMLVQSRVGGNRLLIERILQMESPPQVYVAASAIGIYGNRPKERITEESDLGPSSDFVVDLCRQWEESTSDLVGTSIRRVTLRIGLVLSNGGGIVRQLSQTMPFGIGSYFGNGQQGASWIHIDDLSDLIVHALESDSKVYNGVAPNPVVFKELIHAMARRKGLGITLPVPKFMLQLVMGERSEAILQDLIALPASAQQDKFDFKYPTLDLALDQIMSK